jgi:transcriptional regulator with GAF, ATPase, and Fis domain
VSRHDGYVDDSTLRSSQPPGRAHSDGPALPGVTLVFAGGARAIPLVLEGGTLEIGRAHLVDDQRVSRRHARVSFDGRRFIASDLGSQNGTFADGEPVPPEGAVVERVLRIGDSLLLPARHVRPIDERGVKHLSGFVRGPAMQLILDEAVRSSAMGAVLHIRGESGSGKEGVAHWFHRHSAHADGPFVAVNCAAIPHNLAERLLFGAKRGAYSGADADAPGYLQEADGGTLFLDEIGELELSVQVKLLRALESKELLPLGATRSRKVDVQLCSATNKDLRELVVAGKLRDDLYYRIGRPDVAVPPLRDRPEEIAYLVADELRKCAPTLTAHVSLVEQCLLRPWPGNVRELLVEVRAAAAQAAARGAPRVTTEHLVPTAGRPFAPAPAEALASAPAPEPPRKHAPIVDDKWRQRIEETLAAQNGNVAASARVLGLHRNQLRRILDRKDIRIETRPRGEQDDHAADG